MRAMYKQGLLPYSKSYSCHLLATEPQPYLGSLAKRLENAVEGGYLVVDGVFVAHEGEHIEGLGRHYSSSRRKAMWGHRYLSSALVYPEQDAYALSAEPWLSEMMATTDYPYQTASEGLINLVDKVKTQGYKPKGVLVDAEFTSRKTLKALAEKAIKFLGRFKSNNKVIYQGQALKVRDLAQQFPPGVSRYYSKLEVYAKRLSVELDEVGKVDVVMVWKAQAYNWYLSVFITSLDAGIQELIQTYKLRWGLEVIHRLLKQNLALGACQGLAYAAQLQHIDLTITALHHIRLQRRKHPTLSWREAQNLAASNPISPLLTEENSIHA